MKTRYFFILAAMGLLASCTKEADAPQMNEEIPSGAKTYLTVNLDKATKTYLGNDESSTHKVYWSNGDQIKVDEYSSEPLSGLEGDNTSATFIINGVLSDDQHNVLYPLSAWEDATHISLPAVQEWADGNIANNMLPLAGRSAGSITLKHLCAIMKIQVLQKDGGDTDKIRTIRFKGRSSEKVSGSFVISYDTPALTATTGTGTDLVTRITHDQATSTETPVVYYLVVPARTYSDGFQVDVLDEKGHCMTKNKLTGTTLEAGHMYAMDPFEFVPTTTEVGIEISNAQQLINFVTDFNEGNIAQNANATLVSDIVFDAETSAAFNATGGVNLNGGTSGKYYTGTFNGNGYTISGLEATVPMFTTIANGATIKDFTLEGSFTYTQPNSGNDNAGPIAKQLKGTLSNITVNSSVSLVEVERTLLLDLGGLVGRANNGSASIDQCKFNGSILIPTDYKNTKRVYIGGIAGYTTQTLTIQNSSFGGTIKYLGTSTRAYSEDEPGVGIGGIVGCNQKATVQNCTSVDSKDKASILIGETEYKASIIAQSATAKYVAIGGIVGYNFDNAKVKSSCSNYITILDNISSSDSYLSVGGVVGTNSDNTNAGSVSDATNYGVLTHMSTCPNQRLGGVIGFDKGTTSNCSNEKSGNVTVNVAAQNMRVGGVIGEKAGGTLSGEIGNKGSININDLTAYGCEVGGVIGRAAVEIGGSSMSINNTSNISITSGDVKFTEADGSNEYGLFFGGVVGYSTNAVKYATNTGNLEFICNFTGDSGTEGGAKYVHMGGIIGKLDATSLVDVESCTNTGNVKFDPTNTAPHSASDQHTYAAYSNCYLGGIVGYADLANIKGTLTNKTTNSGNIKGGDGSGNNNTAETFWVGGIVGKLTGASSSIRYCELIGKSEVYNNHFSNKAYSSYCPMCGGIAGEVLGASSAYATVSNCQIESTANVVARRGDCGGIVGYARYADLSSCTMSRSFGNSAYCYGGIVGWLRDGTVTECHFTGASITSSQMQVGGGIVGRLQSATIDGCYSHATDISKNSTAVDLTGALAGEAYGTAANNIIKKSHYKSSMTKICGSINTTYTVGTGDDANAADL